MGSATEADGVGADVVVAGREREAAVRSDENCTDELGSACSLGTSLRLLHRFSDAPATAAAIVTASDALFILRAAVGSESCELCVCDVDSGGSVAASDALAVLQFAVGLDVTMSCPPCAS